MDRERKVDLEKLSEERFQELSKQLGFKVEEIIKENKKKLEDVSTELNKILNIYGLKAIISYQITTDKISKE